MSLIPLRGVRFYTQSVAAAATHAAPSQSAQPIEQRYPYFIPRNSRGSLPVYSDIRNGGTRYLNLIRNVDGDVNVSTCP